MAHKIKTSVEIDGTLTTGEYGTSTGHILLDTTPTNAPTSVGALYWDAENRTLAINDGVGNTTLQVGQEERTLIHNGTGVALTDGQVVYITGSTGELPSVALASNTSEETSNAVLGVVTESIANGANGFVTSAGVVHGLNTLSFNEGDVLWLGSTPGTFTNIKPISPNHLVLIGYVVKKAGGNGSIIVKIQNTQELDECSDVLFGTLANNDLLVYESSTGLWKNKSVNNVIGYTSENVSNKQNSLAADGTGVKYPTVDAINANVVHIAGNETITGSKVFTGANTRFDIPLLLKKSGLSEYNQVSSYSGKLQFTENSGTQFNFSMGSDYFDFGIVSLGKVAKITNTLLSANRTYDLPNASGTIALTSDIPSSSSYIQNQASSAQPANMWISGDIKIGVYTYNNNGLTIRNAANTSYLWSINKGAGDGSEDWNFYAFNRNSIDFSLSSSTGAATFASTVTATNFLSNDNNNGYNIDVNKTGGFGSSLALRNSSLSSNALIRFFKPNNIDFYNLYTSSTGIESDGTVTASNGTLIGGTLTSGYIPKATGANSLGNSLIYDNGTNVGINTTSPRSKFNVVNSYYAGTPTKANSAAFFDNQGVGIYIGGNEYSYGYIQAEQTDIVSIKNLVLQPNGGNVLIGTTTDNGYKLNVNGSIAATSYTGSATLTGTPTAPTAAVGTNTTQIATTAFVANGLATKQNTLTNPITGTGTTNYLPKFTGANALGNSLIYDNGTNVGIGTSSPSVKLHLLASAENEIRVEESTNNAFISLYQQSLTSYIIAGRTGGTPTQLLAIYTGGSERMRITSGGNVLIGTTTDNWHKLNVNGSIAATSYTGSATLTGTPTAPTAAVGTNTTQIATTAFVQSAVSTGGTSSTNLAYTASPTNGIVTSDTGTDATLTLATGTNAGLLAPDDFTKLASAITGSLTTNYIPKASGTNSLTNSSISESGGFVTINSDTIITGSLDVSTITSSSSIRVGDTLGAASSENVGALRYREVGNNSYTDMCMRTGASTYEWVNIITHSW